MGENDWIKKEIERELLDAFVDSYRLITGRNIDEIESSESPDFLAMIDGRRGGVEVAELRVDSEIEPYSYVEEAWRIAGKPPGGAPAPEGAANLDKPINR